MHDEHKKIYKISNNQNSKIKLVSALQKDSKFRLKNKKFVIEGKKIIDIAINKNIEIEFILIREESDISFYEKHDMYFCSARIMDKLCAHNNEKYIAVCNYPKTDFNNYKKSINNVYLVLDSLENPGNIGSIYRSAESFGIRNVLLADCSSDIYNPRTIHNSRGAIFNLSIVKDNKFKILDFLEKNVSDIFATEISSSSLDITNTHMIDNFAIIIGNEHNGISSEFKRIATKKIKIPSCGKSDSLNVSVATGIICYHIYLCQYGRCLHDKI